MNKRWVSLLGIMVAACLWFGGLALFELVGYFRLPAHTKAQIETWEVEERSSKFFLVATYFFEVKGEKYAGRCSLKEPAFLNRFSAEAELKRWESYRWSVWYNPKSPKISSLQKLFPYKRLTYALISFSLLGYFLLFPTLHRQTFSRTILKNI